MFFCGKLMSQKCFIAPYTQHDKKSAQLSAKTTDINELRYVMLEFFMFTYSY